MTHKPYQWKAKKTKKLPTDPKVLNRSDIPLPGMTQNIEPRVMVIDEVTVPPGRHPLVMIAEFPDRQKPSIVEG